MTIFTYSAAQKTGTIVKGEKEAENQKALAVLLKKDGLLLLQAEDRGKKRGFGIHVDVGELIAHVRRISLVDKMLFARNLSVMVNAGMALTQSLDALSQETANLKFRRVIEDLHTSITAGKSFAESLRGHVAVFGTLFANMVEVGETTGKLSLVLKLIANQMQKDNVLRKRVKGAMMYPAVIVIALLCIGALMMIYVVPTLTQTLEELGADLPFATRIIIATSKFMVAYALLLPLIAAGVIFGFWRILKNKHGKELFDKIVLKLPIFGTLVNQFNAARFCRTLSYLIMSGVPIVRSLEITASVLGNTLFKQATEEAAKGIQTGKQLNEILSLHPKIFRHIVIQMIQVGEQTGKLSEMLLRLALFFEEDVSNATKNMSTIIEPVLMIFVGIAVGFFAMAILQPIYSSMGNI